MYFILIFQISIGISKIANLNIETCNSLLGIFIECQNHLHQLGEDFPSILYHQSLFLPLSTFLSLSPFPSVNQLPLFLNPLLSTSESSYHPIFCSVISESLYPAFFSFPVIVLIVLPGQ